MRMAAIYARVSSEQQRQENTIASQTASLIQFAQGHDLEVPKEWVFEDEGYSGATLERPGLERVRDLAAEGQIQVVLAYSPDRLSRKYAYQILLMEEFARQGVETLFVRAPQGASAEDQLLVQFQGMIAEYERAQILERSRRRKRHRAQAGEISVMSGAPYGYRYIRKSDEAPAAYTVREDEARVVRRVFEMYTVEGLSIGEITRHQRRRYPDAQGKHPVGALNGLGRAAQFRVSGPRLLWQDARLGPNARSPPTASARRDDTLPDSRSRAPARRVDPDSCASPSKPRLLCPRARASSGEQNPIAPAHHRAQCGPGAGQLSEVRLRLVAHFDAHQRAQDSLLQMHRLRRLAQTGRADLHQSPPHPTGSARSDRLGRGHPIVGRPGADPTRTGPSPSRRALVRSDRKTRTESAEGIDACW